MNISELIDKFGSMVNEELTEDELWEKSYKGDPSILSDPRVSKIKNSRSYGSTPLHELAWQKVKEVLNHPDAGKAKDKDGWTPLHILAWQKVKEVLDHPDVNKIKDKDGETPLHVLAYMGVRESWLHPDFFKIKSKDGETPKNRWISGGYKPLSTMDVAKLKFKSQ